MKRILLFTLVLLFAASTFAQRVYAPKELRNIATPKGQAITESTNFKNLPAIPSAPVEVLVDEEIVGLTYYDLQSNSSMQNRIHVYDDGTMGAVYTYGMNHTSGFDDRGTGYNYYDGNAWGAYSTERIESDRTGWPAYAPLGENGEISGSHYSGAAEDGILFIKRAEKGTGDWESFLREGPDGHALLWPRMATGGVDNSVIHMLPITTPTGNGGTLYEGVDGAMVYSRSTDGGATWDIDNVLLDEINADYYLATSGDTYEIQSDGDNVAILFGDSFQDLVMLKSTDAGDTWTKTVIYETPYPLWDPAAQYVTDTFYCSDGAHALTFDNDGMVHVAFGINRTYSDGAGSFWFAFVDGLGYWNESRPIFSNTHNSLNPYLEDGSELVEDYSLVGWAQDVNGNGEWDVLTDEYALYYMGASSMPSIAVDDENKVYIVYSSMTETYDNGLMNFRHLWARTGNNKGEFWGDFVHLTGDLIHIFDECVFPSISHTSDDNIHLVYQYDTEPGLHVRGTEHAATENKIGYMKVDKADLISGIESTPAILNVDVAQNQPNPFSTTSTVYVNLREASNLSMEVTNMMGQVVYRVDAGYATTGLNKLTIDAREFSNGVYFYTVKAGEASVTKKMIVE